MATEESSSAVLLVDIPHGRDDTEPRAGIFCELGVRGLKQDFDAVKWTDDGFGLNVSNILAAVVNVDVT